jgi:hypothetical protein
MKIVAEFDSNEELVSFINTFETSKMDGITIKTGLAILPDKQATKSEGTIAAPADKEVIKGSTAPVQINSEVMAANAAKAQTEAGKKATAEAAVQAEQAAAYKALTAKQLAIAEENNAKAAAQTANITAGTIAATKLNDPLKPTADVAPTPVPNEITLPMIRNTLLKAIEAGKDAEARELTIKHGAKNLTSINPDQYAAIYAEALGLLQ